MSKIILLEGVATSGKSIVQGFLKEELELQGYSCLGIAEREITKTFLSKNITTSKSNENLKKFFAQLADLQYDFIIVDRSHFSNISYFGVDFEEFKDCDDILAVYKAKLIFLRYDEGEIISRIRNSLQYRKGRGYMDHFNEIIKNAKTMNEEDELLVQYYKKGIRSFDDSSKKTKIDTLILDVSHVREKEAFKSFVHFIIEFIK